MRRLRHARHHRERRLGAGQRLHLGLLVHAQHHRSLGRIEIQADDVEDLLDEQRVVGLSLNESARCGLSSNARQIRPIVDLDSPLRWAIFARDQCVAFAGVASNVATTTSST